MDHSRGLLYVPPRSGSKYKYVIIIPKHIFFKFKNKKWRGPPWKYYTQQLQCGSSDVTTSYGFANEVIVRKCIFWWTCMSKSWSCRAQQWDLILGDKQFIAFYITMLQWPKPTATKLSHWLLLRLFECIELWHSEVEVQGCNYHLFPHSSLI